MFYIYILYSLGSDKFYVGYSTDPHRRLIEHNTKAINTYTCKHRPWVMKAVFQCSEFKAEAMKVEKFIKKQKSRQLLERLCDLSYQPVGQLASLVRVPHVRD